MTPLRTVYVFEGENELLICPTIYHKDKLWLAPVWRDNPEEKYTRPERIILLETIPHQKSDGKHYDFLLNAPVPKALFLGQPYVQKEILYVVEEDPDIFFPLEK